jgi:hypothetical protein
VAKVPLEVRDYLGALNALAESLRSS